MPVQVLSEVEGKKIPTEDVFVGQTSLSHKIGFEKETKTAVKIQQQTKKPRGPSFAKLPLSQIFSSAMLQCNKMNSKTSHSKF
jgi:hypothetical protein